MKANAPEKLYLHPTASGNVGASWLTFQLTDEDIEYIRKDTFIEKACDWMDEHCKLLTSKDYEDFRKYMEGE